MLTGLMPRGLEQGDLFQPETQECRHSKLLMEAMDRINARMGSGTVAFAAEGIHKVWRMRAERRSRRYTTRWDELKEVKA